MPIYTRKPSKIDAIQWDKNHYQISEFCADLVDAYGGSRLGFEDGGSERVVIFPQKTPLALIVTMSKTVYPGGYIIRRGPGRYDVMEREEFESKYEPER